MSINALISQIARRNGRFSDKLLVFFAICVVCESLSLRRVFLRHTIPNTAVEEHALINAIESLFSVVM
jgi:hypothetical protein